MSRRSTVRAGDHLRLQCTSAYNATATHCSTSRHWGVAPALILDLGFYGSHTAQHSLYRSVAASQRSWSPSRLNKDVCSHQRTSISAALSSLYVHINTIILLVVLLSPPHRRIIRSSIRPMIALLSSTTGVARASSPSLAISVPPASPSLPLNSPLDSLPANPASGLRYFRQV